MSLGELPSEFIRRIEDGLQSHDAAMHLLLA